MPLGWLSLTAVLRYVPFVRVLISLFEALPKNIHPLLWRLLVYTVLSGVLELVALASLLPAVIAILTELPPEFFRLFPFLPAEKKLLILYLIGGASIIIALKGLVQILISIALSRVARDLSRWLGSAHFENLLARPLRYFEKNEPASDINKSYLLTIAVPTNLILPLFRIFTELLVGCVIVIALLIVFPALLLPLTVLTLLFYLGIRKTLARVSRVMERAVTLWQERLFASIEALYLMNTEVRVFHATPLIAVIFSESLKKTTEGRRWFTAIGLASHVSVEVIGAILLFVFVAGSYFLLTDRQFLFYVGVFGVGLIRMIPVVSRISVQWSLLRPFLFLADYLKQIKTTDVEPLARILNERKKQPLPFRHIIALESVSFSYDGKEPLFQDLNFSIASDDTVAVIGPSGTGKTTLLKLILALEKPQKGILHVDHTPITTDELAQRWHASVGYVPQSSKLLPIPMWQNLALGEAHSKEELDIQWLYYLLERLQVRDVIDRLPQGLDTIPALLGVNFSAGQLQRLALVRALYRKPAFLVLDEPTSNLDANSEDTMLTLIQELKEELNLTLLLVTHRQAPLRLASRVYRIEKEPGKPARLLPHKSPRHANNS